MIFKAARLVPTTPTALRQRDQIDHTNRQETGPEPNLKAQGPLLNRAKQGKRDWESVASMVPDLKEKSSTKSNACRREFKNT